MSPTGAPRELLAPNWPAINYDVPEIPAEGLVMR